MVTPRTLVLVLSAQVTALAYGLIVGPDEIALVGFGGVLAIGLLSTAALLEDW